MTVLEEFSRAQKDAYLANRWCCPICQSTYIKGYSYVVDLIGDDTEGGWINEGGKIAMHLRCGKCFTAWADIYELANIVRENFPEQETSDCN